MKTTRLLVVALFGTVASAQEDPLAGPRVEEAPERPSIVERGFDGSVEVPAQGPELAALERLGLTEPQRARVDAVLLERAVLVDSILLDNIALVTRFQAAAQSTDRRERREVFGEAFRAFRPVLDRGSLREEIASALDDPTAFERMLEEYDEATTEGMGSGPMLGRSRGRGAGGAGARFRSLGQEIVASYERLITDRTDRLDTFMDALDLPSDKAERVRTIISDAAVENGLRSDPATRRALVQRILRELNAEERAALLKLVRDAR